MGVVRGHTKRGLVEEENYGFDGELRRPSLGQCIPSSGLKRIRQQELRSLEGNAASSPLESYPRVFCYLPHHPLRAYCDSDWATHDKALHNRLFSFSCFLA
jgi:hypothetical protein